jgi:hypothetical protein
MSFEGSATIVELLLKLSGDAPASTPYRFLAESLDEVATITYQEVTVSYVTGST